MILYGLLSVSVVLGLYAISIYNRLVMLKNNVKKSWANIDVLLKQRHDELPKLIAVCQEYMRHEHDTLARVIAARSRVDQARENGDFSTLCAAEGQLRTGLGQLFGLVESYPELRANEQFLHLQSRITGLENAIADRREYYNESVNSNNVGIEVFPALLVARLLQFKAFEPLYFEQRELTDVDVAALFRKSA